VNWCGFSPRATIPHVDAPHADFPLYWFLAANYYLIYNYYLNNNALNPVTIVVNSEKPTASDEKSVVVVVNKEKTHPNIGHQAPASAEKQTKMEQPISTYQSDFLDAKIPTVLRNYEIEVFQTLKPCYLPRQTLHSRDAPASGCVVGYAGFRYEQRGNSGGSPGTGT
jgi:hypothetical protein